MLVRERRGYNPMVYMRRPGHRGLIQVTAEEAGLRPEEVSPYYGMGEAVDYSQGLPTPVSGMGAVVPLLPIDAPIYQMPRDVQLSYLGQATQSDIIRTGNTIFTVVGLAGAAISGVIAYLLLANAGKWKGAGGFLGYLGGGIFTLSTIGGIVMVIVGREALGLVEKQVMAPPPAAPMPMPGTVTPTTTTDTSALKQLREQGTELLKKMGISI